MFQFLKETKKIFFLLIITFSFTKTSIAYEKIKDIEITKEFKIDFNKKNLKRFYSYLKDINFTKVKSRDEKKWINAIISYNNNKYSAKVRINGSPLTMDHIDFSRGMASLHVKLKNGDISGINNFRLLLPRSKNYENEIFWSLLMENLNYPTPYTSLVKVNFNGNKTNMIFQEKVEHSFMKRWSLEHYPVVEGNTSFWMKNRVNCMKLNKKEFETCFSKNNIDFIETYKIENNKFVNLKNFKISYDAILSNNYYYKNIFDKINEPFGSHGLSFKNTKYIYDPFYNHKFSIYFDGDISFNKLAFDCKNIDLKLISNLIAHYKTRTTLKLNKKFQCIANYYLKNKNFYFQKPQFGDIKNNSIYHLNFDKKKNIFNLNYNNNLIKFELCNKNLYCENLSHKDIKKILVGSHSIYESSNIQRVVLSNKEYFRDLKIEKKIIKSKEYKLLTQPKSLNYLKFTNDAKIDIMLAKDSKIIITNSNIEKLKISIKFLNEDFHEFETTFFKCLSFLDSKIKYLEINYNNICDKSSSFIRSKVENYKVY